MMSTAEQKVVPGLHTSAAPDPDPVSRPVTSDAPADVNP
jgi:hypothetical protein